MRPPSLLPRSSARGTVALVMGLLGSCAHTPALPEFVPVTEDYYPAASKRLGEEGRVLVEFRLDEHRRPFDVAVRGSDIHAPRLNEGAVKAIKSLRFDPADRTRINPKHVYRVTIIYCLNLTSARSDNASPATEIDPCAALAPFPDTQAIKIIATRLRYAPLPDGTGPEFLGKKLPVEPPPQKLNVPLPAPPVQAR